VKALFALLLLLIVIAATVTPCCVYEDCGDEEITLINTNNSEEDREGACSPFFSCASCCGFVWTTKPVQLASLQPAKPVYFEAMAVPKLQAVYSSFWQPPRAT
jgi:hypothetical protein